MDRSSFLAELHSGFSVPPGAIAELVREATGRDAVHVERLVLGDEYEVYRARLDDGDIVYPRIAVPDAAEHKVQREVQAMERARDAGVPVPDVLAVQAIREGRQAMVVRAAPGRQLSDVRSVAERRAAMTDLGRVLARLHSVRVGGRADASYERYLAGVLRDCEQLAAAGFAADEVERIRRIVGTFRPADRSGPAVLCHGDISAAHVFVDEELRVCGLIDWGLWSAGTAADDLAGLVMRNEPGDVAAVLTGHYGDRATDAEITRAIAQSVVTHSIGQIRWLVSSGQRYALPPNAAVLRRAVAILQP